MFADDVKGLAAEVHELLELVARSVPSVYHIGHVRRQHKGHPVPEKSNVSFFCIYIFEKNKEYKNFF